MDPNKSLDQARAASSDLDIDCLMTVLGGLDDWLSKGGFLPEDWQRDDVTAVGQLHIVEANGFHRQFTAALGAAVVADGMGLAMGPRSVMRLVETFGVLDEHLSAGGALPTAWDRASG